jgi:hypothetical protein
MSWEQVAIVLILLPDEASLLTIGIFPAESGASAYRPGDEAPI